MGENMGENMETKMKSEKPKPNVCRDCGSPVDRISAGTFRNNPPRYCYKCLGKRYTKRYEERKELHKAKSLIKRTARNPVCIFQQGSFCTNKNQPYAENDTRSTKKSCSYGSKGSRASCPLFKPWQTDIYEEIIKKEKKLLEDLDIEK